MAAFKLDQVQADAILDIASTSSPASRSRRSSRAGREEEASQGDRGPPRRPRERWEDDPRELAALGEKYGDKRRTQLSAGEELAYDPEAYIVHETRPSSSRATGG